MSHYISLKHLAFIAALCLPLTGTYAADLLPGWIRQK
jgi:hypothetical protein